MLPFLENRNVDLFTVGFADFNFPPHFHSSLEIFCVESGEITLLIDYERHILRAGEICVIFPGQIHSYETQPKGNNRGFVLLLGSNLLGETFSELSGKIPECPICRVDSLHSDCVSAVRLLREGGDGDYRIRKAYTGVFLARYLQNAELIVAEGESMDILYKLVYYMEKHFREDLSLEKIAGALFVSRYKLSRIFSNVFKMRFNDYLNGLRINLAMQLMDGGAGSLASVAYEVGFDNVRTFNRAFKKQCSMTPKEYRERSRN